MIKIGIVDDILEMHGDHTDKVDVSCSTTESLDDPEHSRAVCVTTTFDRPTPASVQSLY